VKQVLLEGKSVLVTGAGSGIGRAAAEVFAAHGARLLLVDVNGDTCKETAELFGGRPFVADVSKADDVEAMVEAAVDAYGRLDGAFNNAGVDGAFESIAESTRANWDRVGLGLSAYVAAKHGVLGLTKAAALEYATQGIRVNAICPGTVKTGMYHQVVATGVVTEEQIAAMQPINRPADPREIAEAAAWLLADQASFVTGQALAVDGGLVTQ
jgi:NAD(P)-dependent dehydrogenase (short-subunit alcohol dehydrogenase family)